MSTISDIYGSYRDALNFSRNKFTDLYNGRAENARDFYDAFLNRLICPLASHFTDPATVTMTRRRFKTLLSFLPVLMAQRDRSTWMMSRRRFNIKSGPLTKMFQW
jgi:hypothetical protein